MLELYEGGYRCVEIASMWGRTESSVRLKLLGMGLSSRRILSAVAESEPLDEIVTDEVPSEVAEDVVRLRAQRELELRERRVEDRKQIDDAKRDILEDRILEEFKRHLCNLPRLEKSAPLTIVPRPGPLHTAVLVISDVHAGQVIDSREIEGLGFYNPAVTLARLHLLEQEVGRILRERPIDKLLLLFGGDILHGHLGHSLEDDLTVPIALQSDLAIHLFFHFLTRLSCLVPRIEVHGVAGNHGRWPGMRKMPTERRWSNLDTIFYSALAALCEFGGLQNINFDERISSRRMIDVGRCRLELLHGDEIRGGAFCTGGMSREVTNATLRNVQAGRQAVDYFVMGDKHFSASVPYGTGAFVVNGSFVGVDGFGMNFIPAPPAQTLFFLHPALGKVESHELRLQNAENSETLPYPLKPSLAELIRRFQNDHPLRL